MTVLTTISDDRSGRKGGLYRATQKKMEQIITNNDFIDYQFHYTIDSILQHSIYEENKKMLDHSNAAKNGRVYKPIVIKWALNIIEDGDFLIYSDCSPEMWPMDEDFIIDDEIYDIEVIKELCIKNKDFLTAFVKWDNKFIPPGELGIHTHNNFTSDSCIQIMNGEDYRHSFQCASGMICIRKTAETVTLVNNWLHYNKMPECACMNVDETENSYHDRKPGNKWGNRHDQSILSMLLNQQNYDYVDIVYNDLSPYNFLNFCRRDTKYSFINSNIKIKQHAI